MPDRSEHVLASGLVRLTGLLAAERVPPLGVPLAIKDVVDLPGGGRPRSAVPGLPACLPDRDPGCPRIVRSARPPFTGYHPLPDPVARAGWPTSWSAPATTSTPS